VDRTAAVQALDPSERAATVREARFKKVPGTTRYGGGLAENALNRALAALGHCVYTY
jgi:hypothetical protein